MVPQVSQNKLLDRKEELRQEASMQAQRMQRAQQLLSALSGESARWHELATVRRGDVSLATAQNPQPNLTTICKNPHRQRIFPPVVQGSALVEHGPIHTRPGKRVLCSNRFNCTSSALEC